MEVRTFADGCGVPCFLCGTPLRHHVGSFRYPGDDAGPAGLSGCCFGTIRRNFVTGCAYAEELLYAVVCADGRGGHQWTGQFPGASENHGQDKPLP